MRFLLARIHRLRQSLLDENAKSTREQVRDWFQKNRNACRCTGYKPLVDAVMDAAKVMRGEMTNMELAYKLPSDGKVWGTAYPRPSAVAKVTECATTARTSFARCPPTPCTWRLFKPRFPRQDSFFDTSEAAKMPGVEKVITHKDVKGKNRNHRSDHIPHQ